jgi:trehalose 6-phosphate phosphatase
MSIAFPLPAPDLRKVALLLDVDGTILDIARSPREVSVPPALYQTLQRLWDRTAGALAFVSGRPIRDLDRIFSPLRLPAIGGHGAEFRSVAEGDLERSRRPSLDKNLRCRLAEIAKGHDGIIVEDKGYSLALHYRLAPDQEDFVRTSAAAICSELPQVPIELLPGKSMVEIKQVGFNKASGVRRLMTHHPFADRQPIFIGDDITDVDVFALIPEFDGIAIAVGAQYSGVANYMDRPADVRCWLDHVSRNGEIAES